MTPNRPPSCDLPPEFYQTKLKPCPFCDSTDVELRVGYDLDELRQYVRCNNCDADGPWSDDEHGTKWNSIPRRSEVLELIRLVEHMYNSWGWDEAKQREQLVVCAVKLRKEMES